MRRLVLLLALGLGWVAYNRMAKVQARAVAADAFPFPTADSHERISIDEPSALADWCARLGCTDDQLRDAVTAVGRSAEAVKDHLARAA